MEYLTLDSITPDEELALRIVEDAADILNATQETGVMVPTYVHQRDADEFVIFSVDGVDGRPPFDGFSWTVYELDEDQRSYPVRTDGNDLSAVKSGADLAEHIRNA